MLYINCPHCGMRSQNEFSYGGDASVIRPELNKEVSDQEWDNFVYNRKSLRGKHLELWQHISGCRQWIKVERDTLTHEIHQNFQSKRGSIINDKKILELEKGGLINREQKDYHLNLMEKNTYGYEGDTYSLSFISKWSSFGW